MIKFISYFDIFFMSLLNTINWNLIPLLLINENFVKEIELNKILMNKN